MTLNPDQGNAVVLPRWRIEAWKRMKPFAQGPPSHAPVASGEEAPR